MLDARFEVLGSPFSLLSVSLSASQNLYTRKGTLVGLGGKAENVRPQTQEASPLLKAYPSGYLNAVHVGAFPQSCAQNSFPLPKNILY